MRHQAGGGRFAVGYTYEYDVATTGLLATYSSSREPEYTQVGIPTT